MMDPPDLIASRYKLGDSKPIGVGYFGGVWLYEDKRLEREVAIKFIISPAGVLPPLEEAKRAARMNHPYIVAVDDVLEVALEYDGTVAPRAFVMERLDGPSVAGAIDDEPDLVREHAMQWCAQAASALSYAHSVLSRDRRPVGVVHGDLHAGNVVLHERDGKSAEIVKVTDWGTSTLVTAPTAARGSKLVRAPEAWSEAVPASDYWALGLLLCEMASSERLPRRAVIDNEEESYARREEGLALAGKIDSAVVRNLVEELLRSDPDKRAGAAEVEDAVDRYAREVSTRPSASPQHREAVGTSAEAHEPSSNPSSGTPDDGDPQAHDKDPSDTEPAATAVRRGPFGSQEGDDLAGHLPDARPPGTRANNSDQVVPAVATKASLTRTERSPKVTETRRRPPGKAGPFMIILLGVGALVLVLEDRIGSDSVPQTVTSTHLSLDYKQPWRETRTAPGPVALANPVTVQLPDERITYTLGMVPEATDTPDPIRSEVDHLADLSGPTPVSVGAMRGLRYAAGLPADRATQVVVFPTTAGWAATVCTTSKSAVARGAELCAALAKGLKVTSASLEPVGPSPTLGRKLGLILKAASARRRQEEPALSPQTPLKLRAAAAARVATSYKQAHRRLQRIDVTLRDRAAVRGLRKALSALASGFRRVSSAAHTTSKRRDAAAVDALREADIRYDRAIAELASNGYVVAGRADTRIRG